MAVIIMRCLAKLVGAPFDRRACFRTAVLAGMLGCVGTEAGAALESYAPFEANGWEGSAHRSADSGAFSHLSIVTVTDMTQKQYPTSRRDGGTPVMAQEFISRSSRVQDKFIFATL